MTGVRNLGSVWDCRIILFIWYISISYFDVYCLYQKFCKWSAWALPIISALFLFISFDGCREYLIYWCRFSWVQVSYPKPSVCTGKVIFKQDVARCPDKLWPLYHAYFQSVCHSIQFRCLLLSATLTANRTNLETTLFTPGCPHRVYLLLLWFSVRWYALPFWETFTLVFFI